MSPEKHLLDWQTSQTIAESIAPTLGQLYRQKGVEVILFGKTLVNATTIDIIKAHRPGRRAPGLEEVLRLQRNDDVAGDGLPDGDRHVAAEVGADFDRAAVRDRRRGLAVGIGGVGVLLEDLDLGV